YTAPRLLPPAPSCTVPRYPIEAGPVHPPVLGPSFNDTSPGSWKTLSFSKVPSILAVIPSLHDESPNAKTRTERRPSLALTGRREQRERRFGSALLGVFYARASLTTLSCFRRCSACQRSYCACWLSQLSEDVPKAMERRTAISGLIPARPFRIAERVFRLTPRASAASVTVTPSGSRQRVLMIAPG